MALHTDTLHLVARTDAHEGPVHAGDESALYFTSLPAAGRVAIRRLDLATGELLRWWVRIGNRAQMAHGSEVTVSSPIR